MDISYQAPHLRTLKYMTDYYKTYFADWGLIQKGLNLKVKHCAVINRYFPDVVSVPDCFEIVLDSSGKDDRYASNNSIMDHFHHRRSAFVDTTYAQKHSFCMKIDTNSLKHIQIFVGDKIKAPYVLYKENILPYYVLDMASVLPVLFLCVENGDRVLDMCAAPGGKSFLIMQLLNKSGQLVANDVTRKRYNRLKKVIKEYVCHPDSSNSNITLTQWSGSLFGEEEQNSFDKILVDAPCSSERHVILKEFQFRGWSIKKMVENSKLQKELLLSAIKSLKHGGQVVYSTCSLSPIENDGVVKSVLDRYNANTLKLSVEYSLNPIELFPKDTFKYYKTHFGTLVVPVENSNWGPMYFSKITKL